MKWLLILGVVLMGIVSLVLIIGLSLSKKHTAMGSASFSQIARDGMEIDHGTAYVAPGYKEL